MRKWYRSWPLALQEDRIAELVRPVVVRFNRCAHLLQDRVAGEGAEKLVVALARLVDAADDGVDDAKPGRGTDPLRGDAAAGSKLATRSRVLHGAAHGGAESDDAPGLGAGLGPDSLNGSHRALRYPVRLVQRQPAVECGVAGGRQTTGVGSQLADAGYGDEASTAASALNAKLTAVEGELTQLEGEGGQDSLNFPGRLDQQFNTLYGAAAGGVAPLGSGVKERWADLEPMLQPLIDQIHEIYAVDLAAFNELVGQNGMRVLLKRAEDSEDSEASE